MSKLHLRFQILSWAVDVFIKGSSCCLLGCLWSKSSSKGENRESTSDPSNNLDLEHIDLLLWSSSILDEMLPPLP